MSIPQGARKGSRTITLPREVVDEILRSAAEPGWLHLQDRPWKSVSSLNIDPWYEGSVYGVRLALDGSAAEVVSYWGSSQLQVVGDNEANEEQLAALVSRWKVGQ